MFDIGFAELLIIAVVALLVLGPEKLPVAVRTLGFWFGRIKRSVSHIQAELNEELRMEELRRNQAITKEELEKELAEMRQPFVSAHESAVKEPEPAPASEAEAKDAKQDKQS